MDEIDHKNDAWSYLAGLNRTQDRLILDFNPRCSMSWAYMEYLKYSLDKALSEGRWDDAIDLGLELNKANRFN